MAPARRWVKAIARATSVCSLVVSAALVCWAMYWAVRAFFSTDKTLYMVSFVILLLAAGLSLAGFLLELGAAPIYSAVHRALIAVFSIAALAIIILELTG